MPKIVISTSSFNVGSNAALQALAAAGYEIVVNPHGRRVTEAEAAALLRDGDVVGIIAGTEPLSRAALETAKSLKVISRCGIGTDNVDLDAARALDIDVLNTPDAPSAAVAELALGLMLSSLRHIAAADRGVRAGEWRPLMGGMLGRRVIGVVGYGRIGRRVAALAAAFGARILAYDVRDFEPGPGVERVELESLLASSDIVSLHMPSAPHKRPLITAERLAQMKRGAILVNTARGDLVDEQALEQALSAGHLAGAALDTYAEEPYTGSLRNLPQVTLTAHMGSYAQETRATMEEEAARNLLTALAARGLVAPPIGASQATREN